MIDNIFEEKNSKNYKNILSIYTIVTFFDLQLIKHKYKSTYPEHYIAK